MLQPKARGARRLARSRTMEPASAGRLAALAGLAMLLVATGCASAPKRPVETREKLLAARARERETIAQERRTVVDRLIRRAEHERALETETGEPQTIDMLLLSGGGALGSFGAGVLVGWGEVEDPQHRRPMFDVVTGISTGSLIAPFAFIGTDESARQILELYQSADEKWVRYRPGLAVLPSNPSLLDPSGLYDAAREVISLDVMRQIADGYRDDRVMLIGTTNLDFGFMRVWNLTEEAGAAVERGDPSRPQDIIFASTAIPAAFPPIEIDGRLHADGGATMNVFVPTRREHILNPATRDELAPGVAWPRIRVWAIINNKLLEQPEPIQARWIQVARLGLGTSIRTSLVATLRDLELLSFVMRALGIDIEFRYITIPEDFDIPASESMLDSDVLRQLGDLGVELGRDPGSWKAHVPSPEWPPEFFEQR